MLSFTTHEQLDAIPRADWNRLVDADTPFLRHEFLAAMERHDCVGEALGWVPRHLAVRDDTARLVAAAPAYLKYNSYGELVFDWSWADAYRRAGLRYYPKLVIASPYTPATGPRLLSLPGAERRTRQLALIEGAQSFSERLELSSLHWLFTTPAETELLAAHEQMPRLGCQFHWHNRGHQSFAELLATFSAEKRKKIKRERRRVNEAGIHFGLRLGHEASEAEWAVFHRLYRLTFDRRGGIPTLSLPFFHEIATTMGEHLLLIFAYQGKRIVAAAFCLIGERTLFGRHWGCFEQYHSLHFETCYYQGLDFCIASGLERFEPGAQGEHKVSRGFLPTATWSAHWIADERFRRGIAQYLDAETHGMRDYLAEMQAHSPYRRETPAASPHP